MQVEVGLRGGHRYFGHVHRPLYSRCSHLELRRTDLKLRGVVTRIYCQQVASGAQLRNRIARVVK
jgi:hypothetical protein